MQTMWNTLGDHTKTDVIPYHRYIPLAFILSCNFCPNSPECVLRRYLRVPDNGTLVLDTYPPLDSPNLPADTPIVVILHGITGSSQEAYTRATVTVITKPKSDGGLGARAVVLNFRGCDGSPVTSSRLYHAGETDDFRSVLLWLTHRYPAAPIYAVGFSMGASTLAVYLGQQGGDTPLKAGVCVSNPWEYVFFCVTFQKILELTSTSNMCCSLNQLGRGSEMDRDRESHESIRVRPRTG